MGCFILSRHFFLQLIILALSPYLAAENTSQWLSAKSKKINNKPWHSSVNEKQADSAGAQVYNRPKIYTALTVRLANVKARNKGEKACTTCIICTSTQMCFQRGYKWKGEEMFIPGLQIYQCALILWGSKYLCFLFEKKQDQNPITKCQSLALVLLLTFNPSRLCMFWGSKH